jgi:hypothetical protein
MPPMRPLARAPDWRLLGWPRMPRIPAANRVNRFIENIFRKIL